MPKKSKTKLSFRNHPFVIPVVTFLVLFFLTLAGFIYWGGETIGADDTKVVDLYYNGELQTIPTRAKTVQDLLDRLDIQTDEQDIVEPALDTPISADNYQINVYTSRPVIVEFEGKKSILITAEPTLEGIAKEAGFKIYPEDNLKKVVTDLSRPSQALQDGLIGEKVIIEPATLIFLNLYGKAYEVRTHAESVQDLLVERSVNVIDGDQVLPELNTKISENMQVFVVAKGKKLESVEESVEPPIERKEDPNSPVGSQVVIETGRPGKQVVTYVIETKDGKEIRTEIQSVIVKQPEKRVVRVGTKHNTFSGSFDAALAALRGCEAGGNYANKSNPNYRGAYQFAWGTWNNYAGYRDPADAPPYIQDQKAWETYSARGWQPWPSCSNKLGLQDTYR